VLLLTVRETTGGSPRSPAARPTSASRAIWSPAPASGCWPA